MTPGRILRVLAILAAVLVVFELAASRYTRVAAVEQWLLTPRLSPRFLGDGGPAADLLICNPMGLALDRDGSLLVSDRGRGRKGRVIWRIRDGVARIVAGTGKRGDATGARASDVDFERPEGMAVAADGSLFVSDGFNQVVLRIAPDGAVTRVAGRTGRPGYAGDGGPGTEALLHRPADLRLDSRGNLYIADVRNHCVRRLDPSGRITTVAGRGERGFSPDGTLATEARLDTPWGIGVDPQDRLIVADGWNHRVRRIEPDGRLVTIAGCGRRGYGGDGGLATDALLDTPEGLYFDAAGRMYIGDELNHAIRLVDLDGRISTLVGTGRLGRATLGSPAVGSPVNDPENVVVTPSGDVIFADGENGRVLRIASDGVLRLHAGRGETAACANRW